MNVKPMYVAILPDGTILPGGSTADSAVKAMEREGVPVEGTQVDDIGSSTSLSVRQNPAEGGLGTSRGVPNNIVNALDMVGLLKKGQTNYLTERRVMHDLTAEEAAERLAPIFQHLRVEELIDRKDEKGRQLYVHKVPGKAKPKKAENPEDEDMTLVAEDEVINEHEVWNGKRYSRKAKTRVMVTTPDPVATKAGWKYKFSMIPVGWTQSSDPDDIAAALMGDNSKLVKGTTNRTSAYSKVTKTDGSLIGVNLYPANKLASEFLVNYPYHPISQIIRSIQNGRGVPSYVKSIPTGKNQTVYKVATGLNAEQQARLVAAFKDWKPDVKNPGKKLVRFTTCAGASPACSESCLVYTGQNTAALKNDWKKAACLFALIADPAAYIHLMVREIDRSARAAYRYNKPFFVRMNLLSDIPWEYLVPWMFQRYADADERWFMRPSGRLLENPAKRPKKVVVSKSEARYGRAPQKYPVQFYDYTKVYGRDPVSIGVTNYDLTYSYSGTNFENVQKVLYRDHKRAAVVFVGFKLENGEYVRVTKPRGEAGYGYGLPAATNIFASEAERRRPDQGMVLVVNGDKHDARPLDPPNFTESTDDYGDAVRVELRPGPCIAGLVWKDAGGGETMTAEQKIAAKTALARAENFVTYTQLVEGTGDFKVVDKEGRTFRHNGKRITGFLIAAETPRQTGAGKAGLSLLPGV